MERYVCIHGHFYQPPRENPWLEAVELQDSASPYHDWNERITMECYAPNTASRILDDERRIIDIINNYTRISFNFGPTLLSWMEAHHRDVYESIQEADNLSQERFSGHGAALAQVYNHMIMPLANGKDKYTQVLWGIRDFQKRFGRSPEGMWLAETAVDLETLSILAEQGIAFTILAPRQAMRVRPLHGRDPWWDVQGGRIDPTMPYRCRLPSGRSIALFFYDGPISQDTAFGGILENGEAFAHRLMSALPADNDRPRMVHIATDGETYGHHHRQGEMALSYCLHFIESHQLARITIYGEYLERHPPTHEVEIHSNSSWSCIHGVERWRGNCGCNSGMRPGWRQEWRRPLRDALDNLRDRLIPLFEERASGFLKNPWEARNDYIDVILDRSPRNIDAFMARHSARNLSAEEKIRVLRLLEMQRHAMLMYTSCGWFFDEISGLETTQVLKYAARAIQLAEQENGEALEPAFTDMLQHAPSNLSEFRNGKDVYQRFVKPSGIDLDRVGAHYAISSLFEEHLEDIGSYCYSVRNESYERFEAGALKLAVGRSRIVSDITWEEGGVTFTALHLGDHNVSCCVRADTDPDFFHTMQEEIKSAFRLGDTLEIVRLMDKHFGSHSFTLWHLFKDEQTKVLKEILRNATDEIEFSFRRFVENNYMVINFFNEIQSTLPKPLAVTTEFVLNMDLRNIFEEPDTDTERLQKTMADVRRWNISVERDPLTYLVECRITDLLTRASQHLQDTESLRRLEQVFVLLAPLDLPINLWKAQNLYFLMTGDAYPAVSGKAANGDAGAEAWVETFRRIGGHLRIKVL